MTQIGLSVENYRAPFWHFGIFARVPPIHRATRKGGFRRFA